MAMNKIQFQKGYLAEFQYRFNRRFNLVTFFSKFLKDSVKTPPLSCTLLKVAANCI
jgi:hypothetical protein